MVSTIGWERPLNNIQTCVYVRQPFAQNLASAGSLNGRDFAQSPWGRQTKQAVSVISHNSMSLQITSFNQFFGPIWS